MSPHLALLLSSALFAVGCTTFSPSDAGPGPDVAKELAPVEFAAVQPVDPQPSSKPLTLPGDSNSANYAIQPASLSVPIESPEAIEPGAVGQSTPLSLDALVNMAAAQNPAILRAEARIRALRGKCLQVGLPPNPTAGYLAAEIGDQGEAGQQGAYVGQTIVTTHKLRRARAVVAAEIATAASQLTAMRIRVATDVRVQFYETLVAQRRVEVAQKLADATSEAVAASQSLLDAQEIPLAGLLQTEIQQQNAIASLQTADNRLRQSWRQLAAVVGVTDLPQQPLAGDETLVPAEFDWQQQLGRLQTNSPELAAALADVRRARRALDLAIARATPNVSTQVSVQQDTASDTTLAGVQVGMPIPLWNRNQGAIRQAQAEVTEACRNLQRLELSLAKRLANVYRQNADARVLATTYAENILPRAERTFDLVQTGYRQGEVGYLDLLTAQQTYFQTNLAYLDALADLWRTYFTIEGLLLDESLADR